MKYKQYKRFLFYLVEDELRDLSIHFYESYSSENSENLWESAATESEDLFDTEVLPFSLTASTTNAMTASAISENNWNNIEAQLVGRLSSEDPVDPLLSFPDVSEYLDSCNFPLGFMTVET